MGDKAVVDEYRTARYSELDAQVTQAKADLAALEAKRDKFAPPKRTRRTESKD